MLISLSIENFILIEKAELVFGRGLHILTGETGSGKSAILSAIRLISGEKGGTDLIREGAPALVIEAKLSSFPAELPEEIESPPPGEPLTVRREIQKSGKSRCFIGSRLVPVPVLRKIIRNEVSIVDQSSAHHLCSLETQRNMLDAFADLSLEASNLAASFSEAQAASRRLASSLSEAEQKNRDLEWAQSSLHMIEEAGWQKGEEERLNEEHALLVHMHDVIEKINAVREGLHAGAPQIKRLAHLLEGVLQFNAALQPLAESIRGAALEIEESERSLRSYGERLEANPSRLAEIEHRIAAIEQLKRRFGSCWEEVEKQRKKLTHQIDRLSWLEEGIETNRETARRLETDCQRIANRISERRKEAGHIFCRRVLAELTSLHLPHAQFEVSILPQPLGSHGIDQVRFLFSANPGLSAIPLEQCASGGERSRLLLAIQTVLSDKEGGSCLIFDEIDSNVGGQAAAVLGKKLKKAAEKRQIICVTHFVQVAQAAEHHFLVEKKEKEGNAVTTVRLLKKQDRESEYSRMIGGTSSLP